MLIGSAMSITLVTAGAAALINLWLALRTGAMRGKAKVSIGDGGHDGLVRRMRAHANFVEYAPFILILIGLIEFTTGSSIWLWVVSVLFILARLAHPLGMDGLKGGRMAGTLVTFVLLGPRRLCGHAALPGATRDEHAGGECRAGGVRRVIIAEVASRRVARVSLANLKSHKGRTIRGFRAVQPRARMPIRRMSMGQRVQRATAG
jgi:uncharacterized membrane protein YecN with MAPEG domain